MSHTDTYKIRCTECGVVRTQFHGWVFTTNVCSAKQYRKEVPILHKWERILESLEVDAEDRSPT